MDSIKEAFQKVKQDIFLLQKDLDLVKREILDIKDLIREVLFVSKQVIKEANSKKEEEVYSLPLPTLQRGIQTEVTFLPVENDGFSPLNPKKQRISIGNEGVPTDRQTNQQTNQQTDFNLGIEEKKGQEQSSLTFKPPITKNPFKEAVGMLESLDHLKKELRLKFKRLTDQELLVFSSLYQVEEEKGYADYKSLAVKLNLTESSIREYIGKLIKKGIPVEKLKVNNKSIQLKISSDLKKIANLSTILLLRDM